MKKLFTFFTLTLIAVFTAVSASASEPLVFLNDVDDPATIAEIQDFLVASDDVDGNLTESITVATDGYTGNETTIGTFDIVFSVTDTASQTTMFTVTVDNRDINGPTVDFADYTGDYTILVPLDSTLAEIQAGYIPTSLVIEDAYDGVLTETAIVYDSLVDDPTAIDLTVAGDYPQIIRVTDAAGNETELEYTIRVTSIVNTPGLVWDDVHGEYTLFGYDLWYYVVGLGAIIAVGYFGFTKKGRKMIGLK